MSIIDTDTLKLNQCVLDFNKQIDILRLNTEEYFKLIKGVPSNEWLGSSSIKYVNYVESKKTDYDEFIDNLVQYSNKLSNLAISLEKAKNNSLLGGNNGNY